MSDETVRDFIANANPASLSDMAARFDEAIERGRAARDLGVDAVFVEAPESVAELERIARPDHDVRRLARAERPEPVGHAERLGGAKRDGAEGLIPRQPVSHGVAGLLTHVPRVEVAGAVAVVDQRHGHAGGVRPPIRLPEPGRIWSVVTPPARSRGLGESSHAPTERGVGRDSGAVGSRAASPPCAGTATPGGAC